MNRPFLPPRLRAVALASLVTAATAAGASARADDRSVAETLLRSIEPGTVDAAVKRGWDALERGTRMRGAGDDRHARVVEGLAVEAAEAAVEAMRMKKAESDARAAQTAAAAAEARVERERALLEEAIARDGRLRAELASLRAKGRAPTATKSPAVRPTDADAPRTGAP